MPRYKKSTVKVKTDASLGIPTPCSLAARVIWDRKSSSTKGRTASWMMTTSGLSSARAWTPLYMDLWRVEPPVTTRTFLCPKRWTMPLIWSRFSFATTTTTSWIHDTLPGDAKQHEWFHKYQTIGKYRNISSLDPVPVKTTLSWIKLERLQKKLEDELLIRQRPRAWGEGSWLVEEAARSMNVKAWSKLRKATLRIIWFP